MRSLKIRDSVSLASVPSVLKGYKLQTIPWILKSFNDIIDVDGKVLNMVQINVFIFHSVEFKCGLLRYYYLDVSSKCLAVGSRSTSDFYVPGQKGDFSSHINAIYDFSEVGELWRHCKPRNTVV
jgi:hypothetical protein